ncbi:MAG: peroxidase family protein [Candidatus Limnocylindrales bacterium]
MADTMTILQKGTSDTSPPDVTSKGKVSNAWIPSSEPGRGPLTDALDALDSASIPPIPFIGGSSSGRNTSRDGWRNQIETFATTRGAPLWNLVMAIAPVRDEVNKVLTNSAINKFPHRPEPLSTKGDYTSWSSLTDKRYSSRHLEPRVASDLPPIPDVVELFRREQFIESPKSTVLFSYFAQWFTDGFLRSDRHWDPLRNESNHDIDLTNLYGLTPEVTDQLRSKSGGRLKSQQIGGEEYPEYLYAGGKRRKEFDKVTVAVKRGTTEADLGAAKLKRLFALGSDTSNLQTGFVLHNVLFLREHNRIASELARAYPTWDDERLFETARNIMIVLLIKIVIEDYINHITPFIFKLRMAPKSFANPPWMRANWMSVEFQLLYRWHGLVPDAYAIAGKPVAIDKTLYDTTLVTRHGLGQMFEDASNQPAGVVGMHNTPPVLLRVEQASIEKGRGCRLASYNDYRKLARFPKVTRFDQITSSPKTRAALRDLYGHVDNIEFFAGLFAEDPRPNSVLPALIGRMVGLDAFSQVYPNPLLGPRIYNEKTFSPVGMEIIDSTRTLSQIVNRNVPPISGGYFVSMTRADWKRE